MAHDRMQARWERVAPAAQFGMSERNRRRIAGKLQGVAWRKAKRSVIQVRGTGLCSCGCGMPARNVPAPITEPTVQREPHWRWMQKLGAGRDGYGCRFDRHVVEWNDRVERELARVKRQLAIRSLGDVVSCSDEYMPLVSSVTAAVINCGVDGTRPGSSQRGVDPRSQIALDCDCIPIGEPSHWAHMVAVPKSNPNVVVKVCSVMDGFVKYAVACASGVLSGKHMLTVYSVTEIPGDMYVILCERLAKPTYDDVIERRRMYGHEPNSWDSSEYKAYMELRAFCADHNVQMDVHAGNTMYRADGTLVFCDPVC